MREKSSAWIPIVGIFLALLLCMLGTSMAYVVYPQSSFFSIFFKLEDKALSLDKLALFEEGQPTPFMPAATLTPTPADIINPEPEKAAAPIAQPMTAMAAPEQVAVAAAPAEEESKVEVPKSAYVGNLRGTAQLYTLDCEAQAAVDWAKFFDVNIDESEFIDRMPKSDDPEIGFVGRVNGAMGQLPPNDYGIHASPIAEMLKEYGLPAKAKHDWSLSGIKKEIAAGQPVIAWIVNMPFTIDSQEYTASNGNTTTVARFEHTWIIIGYNASTVTVVDSTWTYNVNVDEFLARWEALGKQAVIYTGD